MRAKTAIRISIISVTIANVDRPWPRMAETRPSVAPEKLRICENVVAPRMMNMIMPEMAVAPLSDFIRAFRLSTRYTAATAMVASAPRAADSVGVAKPPDMAPTTTAKMAPSGTT